MLSAASSCRTIVRRPRRGWCWGFALLLAGVLPTSVVAAKKPKCFPREGRCVAVQVNDQAAVPLTKATRKMLRTLEARSSYVDDTRFELTEPIRGELEVEAGKVAGSESWFGDGAEVQVQVVPLDDVAIATDRHLVTEPTVRIGGAAAVGAADVMRDRTLPPGRYLLRVRVRGAGNWDRQTLYMTVAADGP